MRIPSVTDRFRGCLLGLALGDALGAPFEGIDAYGIYSAFGPARGIIDRPPVDALFYTDDTQMMIGVAEALLRDGRIVEDTLVRAFADNFDPDRGYGPSARHVIEAARDGGDWRGLSRSLQPGGSLGNGAAMRVAPVGLLFRDDPERLWAEAEQSALPTHRHPIGIEGAQLVALAVALAFRGAGAAFDRAAFFDGLLARARTDEFRWQLETARALVPDDTLAPFGNSLRADESVVTALTCFATSPDSYEAAVARAISLGGDTDTLAAMAGAVAGARLGLDALPARPLAMLEDAVKGRTYVDRLAGALASNASGAPVPGSS
jgi:poly(ADP-ribose) glycohydrolase ARH3